MRGRTLIIFAAGFVTGLLVLCVLMWSTGRLSVMKQLATTTELNHPLTAPPIHSPVLPDLSQADRIQRPAPPDAPPPVDTVVPPTSTVPPSEGTADRLAPNGPISRLEMPIQGIDAAQIRDSFRDVRDGHKHEAVDILAPRNTPVHAVTQGNVAKLFTSKEGGLTVYQFDDSGTWCYYYAHLDHYATGLREGMLLRKGDVIGYVGTTGNAPPNTPHLHFAVFKLGPEKKWWQGDAVDPLPLLK